ncbi:MAG: hypothetical protein J6N78_01780 [Clostridia bacterium]|nr:hypothetical protein [Clostridia bacterium]
MDKTLIKRTMFSKENIVRVLNKIFDKKVYRFTYLGKCKLDKMPEYNFCLHEFNVVLEDYTNYTVFIKEFSNNSIKENLFCYWQFCEENYNLNGNFYLNKAKLQNKELSTKENNMRKYSMQLLSKNNKIWKVSDIFIIGVKDKIIQKNEIYYNELYINETDEKLNDFLFIGII